MLGGAARRDPPARPAHGRAPPGAGRRRRRPGLRAGAAATAALPAVAVLVAARSAAHDAGPAAPPAALDRARRRGRWPSGCSTSRDGLLARIDALRDDPGRRHAHPHPRRLPPRPGAVHRARLRDHRLRGRAGRPLGERRIKRPPLRDVAGMLRSFDYAVHAALGRPPRSRPRPRRPRRTACGARPCAGGTRRRPRSSPATPARRASTSCCRRAPRAVDALLDAFVLEKALYELRYELDNRPTWVPLPARRALAALGQLPA